MYTLPQIIDRSALLFPEKDAFRCLEDSISYRELKHKSDQLAHQLNHSGVQKGNRVAVFMNRCLDTAVGIFGILKSGAAYVPIDPFAPVSRSVSILKDCGVEHLVTTETQRQKIRALTKDVDGLKTIVGMTPDADVNVETIPWEQVFSQVPHLDQLPGILEQDLAFILYTSGSTGIPKGIMHTHYSGLALAKIASRLYGFTENDKVGTFAPLHFDPSTFGYFAAPLAGATAVIIPDAHLSLPPSLSALVAKEKITIWYSVPLMLINALLYGEIEKHDFSSLRWVLFAGEVFTTKHLRALMQLWPHAKFSNLYGPAEVILCTYYHLKSIPQADEPIPIGTVWDNTEYRILLEEGTEAPAGVPGELAVRTATMMRGYWNNPELTERSLYRIKVADGYDHVYYKTGDLVKENEQGQLLFLGRSDRQIKLRGFRIELDEIEQTLLKHEGVKEAVVVVVEGENDYRKLSAAINPMRGSHIDIRELKTFCKSHLPSYAIPESIEVASDFPRTSSGKIDRKEIIKNMGTKQL